MEVGPRRPTSAATGLKFLAEGIMAGLGSLI